MGKVETVLKQEIVRLTKKALRETVGPLARDVRRLKRIVSQLTRTVAVHEKITAVQAEEMQAKKAALTATEDEVKASRLSAGLIRKLRTRLGLSQEQLAVIIGVTPAAVTFWEQGRARPSGSNRTALVALRKLGRTDVKDILRQKGIEPKRKRRKKAAKKAARKARKAAK